VQPPPIQPAHSAPSPVQHFLRERKNKVNYRVLQLDQEIQQATQEIKQKCKTMRKSMKKICQSHSNKTCSGCFLSKAFQPCYGTFITSYYCIFILEILALKMNMANSVPNPELTLLDLNFVEPNKLQLLFRPSGKYVASTHFIHVHIPFNFSQLLATPDKFFHQYHNNIEQWPEPCNTQTKVSQSCIVDKVNDFIDILDTLPQHQVVTRHKRFLDLVTLGMYTAALSLLTYNSAQISILKSQIAVNNRKVNHLTDITNLHEQHFKAVDDKLHDVADKLSTMLRINKVHFEK
jgi:hypothetical protein